MTAQATTIDAIEIKKKTGFFDFVTRKPYFLLGLLLVTLLLIQHYYNIEWEALAHLQTNSLYKQASGFLLFFYVVMQWRLAYLRHTKTGAQAKAHTGTHKWLGVLVPVFIYFHTTELGHAYQFALWSVFIATVLVGLFSFQEFKLKKNWFVMGWTIVHVGLATVLPVMMVFHIYITYIYS